MADLIRERYEPLAVAGRGGEGEVVRARDHQHGRDVALKIRAVVDDDREALMSEARMLLDLRPHENLPLVREDFFDGDRYVMVVDWIEGRALSSDEAMSLGDALAVLAPIASALDHLHAHEPAIVHGDVKPANIVVTPEGRAVLVDFGIASPAGSAGTKAGSAGYVAPEVAAAARATPAADVFGFAATLFALLSGGAPDSGARPGWSDLPHADARRIDVAMRRALSVDPARRPRSAGELLAWLTIDPGIDNNLPFLTSSFVGRDREIEETKSALSGARIVTLAATGGSGKTRLALAVAGEALEEYPDGVWFVELAALTDPSLVAGAVAAAAGVREEPGRSITESLRDHLSGRTLLLILDNCEHLIDACARLAEDVLRHAKKVRVLATSREPLGIDGEVVVRVPPLTEAARLFVERARLAKPAFAPSSEDLAQIGKICERLDGIPLAIELAAARTNILTPQQIAARLDDRFDLLTSGSRTVLPRQKTLRALVDWSYELLDEDERELFAHLSVFAGGCTLEAAEEVCGATVLDGIGHLVDKSLVIAAEQGGEMRFSMLETLREYGREKLGDGSAGVLDRHSRWVEALLAKAEPEFRGPDQATWLKRIEREHSNVRSALSRAIAQMDAVRAVAIAVHCAPFWLTRGYLSEARSWFDGSLALVDAATSPLYARGLKFAGVFAQEVGDYEAAEDLYRRALREAKTVDDNETIAAIVDNLGILRYYAGDFAGAHSLGDEALALRRTLGDARAIAESISKLAIYLLALGRTDETIRSLKEAIGIYAKVGDRIGMADALDNLGLAESKRGDLMARRDAHEESLQIREELNDRWGIANCLYNLSSVAIDLDDPDEAERCLRRSLALFAEVGDRSSVAKATSRLDELIAGR